MIYLYFRALNLEACKSVTDVGIRRLCVTENDSGKLLFYFIIIINLYLYRLIYYSSGDDGDIAGCCKSLTKLMVRFTSVTEVGARLAIQHLPKLVVFDCSFSLQALAQLHRAQVDLISQQPQYRYLLSELFCGDCSQGDQDEESTIRWLHVPGGFASSLQLCPFIVSVQLSRVDDLNDEDFKALLTLNCLRCLVLVSVTSLSIEGGLLPVLEKFGSTSLETLELGEFDAHVDICPILQHCSNLLSMCFFQMNFIDPHPPHHQPPNDNIWLPRLESLMIHGDISQVPKTVLSLLLHSAPALISLYLHHVSFLTDQIFEDAIQSHGFPKLEELSLVDCPHVTERPIDLLLTLDNALNEITLRDCDMSEEHARNVWVKMIEDNHWDVILRYSGLRVDWSPNWSGDDSGDST